jgi:hypothetical protein
MATALLMRPSTFDEGVAQLRKARDETAPARAAPTPDDVPPRVLLWRAVDRLVGDAAFLHGMRLLYDANQIVSFLYNSIVPHLEERLRFSKLQDDYDKAKKKPENIKQNTARFEAIVQSLREADATSVAQRKVDADFAAMRQGVRPLSSDAVVLSGLRIVYVSSKTARGCLDLMFERLLEALQNDTKIVPTTDIPMHVLLMGGP